MPKTYLINYSNEKLNFKKKSKIVFRNEYILKNYSKNQLKNFDCSYIDSLDYVYNRNKKEDFIKKKLDKYRLSLKSRLNEIHNINFSLEEWGLLIDHYLILSINQIKQRFDNFKKIQNQSIIVKVLNSNFFFPDTDSIHTALSQEKDLNKFIDYIVLDELGFKGLIVKNKTIKTKIKINNKTFIDFLKITFCKFFSKFFKISVISNGYLGFKNSISLLFLSKLKILFLNSIFFNCYDGIIYLKNKNRNKIKVPENDIFDKIFNKYNQNIFPGSYLENFEKFYKYEDDFCKKINYLCSANLLTVSDIYKFFSIKVKRNGGNVVNFQHGGLFGMRKFSPDDYIINNYADLNFLWHDKKGIGIQYYSDENLTYYKDNKKKEILFFPSIVLYQENTENLKECNHLYLNKYWKFYEFLENNLRNEVKIKLFKHKNSEILKKLWIKRYSENLLLKKNSYKGSIFKNFKIVIIDNFSTPLFELLYKLHPFIMINNSKLTEFNNQFKEIVKDLKDLNILFNCEKKAAIFINSNYDNIDIWWDKIIKDRKFIKIRKQLFPLTKFDKKKFVNIIKK